MKKTKKTVRNVVSVANINQELVVLPRSSSEAQFYVDIVERYPLRRPTERTYSIEVAEIRSGILGPAERIPGGTDVATSLELACDYISRTKLGGIPKRISLDPQIEVL